MIIIGVPTLIIWVVGAPLLVFIVMVRNKDNLNKPYMQKYLLLLYQGLKPEVFYWEFINTFRKLLVPIINVVVISKEIFYQIIATLLVLGLLFRIQIYLKPYKLEDNNQIEMLAVLA